MPIRLATHGHNLAENFSEVTARRILAYAAGLGDGSPEALDDDVDLVASPAICVSLEWPVVSSPDARERLGASDDELRRGVHASQDSIFHRPILPGNRLLTRGRVVAGRESRAGAVLTSVLETVDADTGAPVTTSWSSSIYRGVGFEERDASDGAKGNADVEPPPLPEVEATNGRPESANVVAIPIPRQMPHVYTECAAIWNPIHTERRVALAAGLPDIILHGTATWALAGQHILRHYAGGDPRRLRRLRGRFRAMVVPGTTITLEHGLREPAAAGARAGSVVAFVVRNLDGDEAISDGAAVIAPRSV